MSRNSHGTALSFMALIVLGFQKKAGRILNCDGMSATCPRHVMQSRREFVTPYRQEFVMVLVPRVRCCDAELEDRMEF
jgi:hypothetical protein